MAFKKKKPLKDRFNRFLRRQKLKRLTCLKYNFLQALSNGEFDRAKDVIDLFPEAVNWRGGQSPMGMYGEDSTPLRTVVWSINRNIDPVPMIHYLIDRGAEVNFQSNLGYTPLHLAVGIKHREIIAALLERGADPDLTNLEDLSPRGQAQSYDRMAKNQGEPPIDLEAYIDACLQARTTENLQSCTQGTLRAVKTLPRIRFKK